MKFEDIFKEAGLYVGDEFAEGICFEVDSHGFLNLLTYKDKDDLLPTREKPPIWSGLFKKEYKKVLTRQSLFK